MANDHPTPHRRELANNMLPVSKVHEIEAQAPEKAWLIKSIWADSGVGIIGGAPKCCKSWLGLDMAVSVASGTACLGHFTVKRPGPVLIYLAEDSLPAVRSRITALCGQRKLEIDLLNLFVITAPLLRLDLLADQQRLRQTITTLKPRLLVLDPLVRLHRLDENSSSDISGLLGYLRDIQRAFDTAIVLVHHVGKKQRAQPGQALRGSSDLHAFGDSNVYLARRHNKIIMTLEHRSARPHDPIELELRSSPDGSMTHLEVTSFVQPTGQSSLESRIMSLLQQTHESQTRTCMRDHLKVNNQSLGDALVRLEQRGVITRTPAGWKISRRIPDHQENRASRQLPPNKSSRKSLLNDMKNSPQPIQQALKF